MANKKTSKSNQKSKGAKRHRSAYILFTLDKRQQVKLENPSLSSKEILSELGALWKTADPQTKQYFQKLSDSEKAQHQQKSKATKTNPNEENQSMEVNASQ